MKVRSLKCIVNVIMEFASKIKILLGTDIIITAIAASQLRCAPFHSQIVP